MFAYREDYVIRSNVCKQGRLPITDYQLPIDERKIDRKFSIKKPFYETVFRLLSRVRVARGDAFKIIAFTDTSTLPEC